MDLFVFGEVSEYCGEFFSVDDERVQLEYEVEVMPRVVYYFWVIFLLGYGKVAAFEEEIEYGLEVAIELSKCLLDSFRRV